MIELRIVCILRPSSLCRNKNIVRGKCEQLFKMPYEDRRSNGTVQLFIEFISVGDDLDVRVNIRLGMR